MENYLLYIVVQLLLIFITIIAIYFILRTIKIINLDNRILRFSVFSLTDKPLSLFDKIKVYFNDIFKRLFGGGNAKLILTNKEDILSSGIEIEVEPPDKKPQSLAVLSGGERTLTVIALLFAFFTYNPAPFSVLDEIDAPLDEANVKRFAKFLKDYAKRTQFILVTHRKGTMESADVMYGVTIEDAGVSKLISVRLEDFEERG